MKTGGYSDIWQVMGQGPQGEEEAEGFKEFTATELYCPRCRMSVPVREKLLLILSDGDLYDYTCTRCGAILGQKTDPVKHNFRIS